ncbi:class I SAM-dependent methyltransferase [Georgenia subflava]|uniref:Methyltransferase domain-containing protein n=1 Tax=Georgenia subflava TaxID=1622177 RepID=A0A6N7EG57_9MICO|nr:class I SAM-dependent methyltransferase [Georgenia subflava]MPV36163.1 methyltransferase domain-containing protein [Georgenia subflava]
MVADRVRRAYAARAAEYTAVLGSIDAVAGPDRELVLAWAKGLVGRVLDVGCGPGHWTDLLRRSGVDAEGVDPVAQFIDGARERYPGVPFRVGRADALGVEDGTLGGVLAWYSLIHTEPDDVDAQLRESSRAIAPGGGLLIGFFEGPAVEPFEHAVTAAYRWPVEELADRVAAAGFDVTGRHTRTDEGARPHGAIVAVRRRE